MSLVTAEDLTVAFGDRVVVDRVGFTLDRGETLALVGESGSGKSLTALSLLQLLPPGAGCTGRVVVDGQSVIGAGDRLLRRLRGGGRCERACVRLGRDDRARFPFGGCEAGGVHVA